LNRLKRRAEAEAVLLEVIQEQGPSSETNGLLGRVYKDGWQDGLKMRSPPWPTATLKKRSKHISPASSRIGEVKRRVVNVEPVIEAIRRSQERDAFGS
jgi:hypothetical protein